MGGQTQGVMGNSNVNARAPCLGRSPGGRVHCHLLLTVGGWETDLQKFIK